MISKKHILFFIVRIISGWVISIILGVRRFNQCINLKERGTMSKKNNKSKTTDSDSSEETLNINLGDPYKGLEDSIVGTIFVNRENRIKSIVSSVTELINLTSFDEDLEVKDFARQLKFEGITGDIRQVLKHREIIKKEVEGKNGRWYMLELRPHSPQDNMEGVIITFVDVTDLKEAGQELAEKIEKNKELQRQIIKKDVSERWRIGQFLHDNIGQILVAANLQLQDVKKKLATGDNDVEKDIDQVLEILEKSSIDARDLSHEIVPIEIEEKGISYAFHDFDRQLEKMYDIKCDLEYHATSVNITNIEVATHLYRIAQEAVKNAAVHGGAENIKITLKSDKDYLYFIIEDDGTGFLNSSNGDEGRGIHIMRHRMELMGGTFKITDTSDLGETGITISCKVPVEEV